MLAWLLARDPTAMCSAAFTFGEYVGRDQSSITIEKTDLTVKGLAQFIFSEFCRTYWADRPLVNVGDDWGLETLAWTKMSYRPVKLLQKYMLRKVPVARVGQARPALQALSNPWNIASRVEAMPRLAGTSPLPVTVRVADKRDVTAAVELERACFSPSVSLKKRQLQYLQQRRSAVFLVAEQGGAVVGEGIALLRQHRKGVSGRIYSLAVDSRQCRGQRIGDQLLAAMLEALVVAGARRVYLEVEQGNDCCHPPLRTSRLPPDRQAARLLRQGKRRHPHDGRTCRGSPQSKMYGRRLIRRERRFTTSIKVEIRVGRGRWGGLKLPLTPGATFRYHSLVPHRQLHLQTVPGLWPLTWPMGLTLLRLSAPAGIPMARPRRCSAAPRLTPFAVVGHRRVWGDGRH